MAIVKIRPRRDSAADWTTVNPTLADGEIARETDTGRLKFGTGAAAWNALAYWSLPWSDVSGKPANLTAIGALVSAADRLAYFNGAGTAALATFTAAGRALVDDADAAAQRVTLGLGTMAVEAAATYMPRTGGGFTGQITASASLNANTIFEATNLHANGYGMYLRAGTSGRYILYMQDYAGVERFVFDGAGLFRPGADNVQNLGHPSWRWATVYAGTGTINTSDARAKRDIGAIPDEWLDAWADVQWSRFRFKDGERWHTGLVAQQVRDAFKRHGLDAREIGLLCYDKWPATRAVKERRNRKGEVVRHAQPGSPAGDRWGLRMDECDAIEHALNRRARARQQAEIDDLRKLVTALGGGAR